MSVMMGEPGAAGISYRSIDRDLTRRANFKGLRGLLHPACPMEAGVRLCYPYSFKVRGISPEHQL
jgi:hypothetical protein